MYTSYAGKFYCNTFRLRRSVISVNSVIHLKKNLYLKIIYNINFFRDFVRLEMPDLEAKRTETIVSINDDNNLLKEMEDKTLRMLNMSKGNILDDEELIETLNNSKVGLSKYILHLPINFIFVI